jgi:aspartate/methionine/tyrosine aminotransferase
MVHQYLIMVDLLTTLKNILKESNGMKKNYPPKGEFYMYPQYDEENNLVGFTTDYEGEGAFGKYCKIIATGETL